MKSLRILEHVRNSIVIGLVYLTRPASRHDPRTTTFSDWLRDEYGGPGTTFENEKVEKHVESARTHMNRFWSSGLFGRVWHSLMVDADFLSAIQMQPENHKTRALYFEAMCMLKNPKAGSSVLAEATKNDLQIPRAWLDEASKYFAEATQRDPQSVHALYLRSDVLGRMALECTSKSEAEELLEEASECLKKVKELNRNQPAEHVISSSAITTLGESIEARQHKVHAWE